RQPAHPRRVRLATPAGHGRVRPRRPNAVASLGRHRAPADGNGTGVAPRRSRARRSAARAVEPVRPLPGNRPSLAPLPPGRLNPTPGRSIAVPGGRRAVAAGAGAVALKSSVASIPRGASAAPTGRRPPEETRPDRARSVRQHRSRSALRRKSWLSGSGGDTAAQKRGPPARRRLRAGCDGSVRRALSHWDDRRAVDAIDAIGDP